MKITLTLEECKIIAAGRKLRSDSHQHRDVCRYDHTHRSVAHLKRSAVMSPSAGKCGGG